MPNDNLAQSVAQDFAQFLNDEFGWNTPPDEYFDPISQAIGKQVDRSKLLQCYRSPARLSKLAKALQSWCECEEVSVDLVTAMLKQSIVNNFGRNALDD
jgi:hypothetical protein